MKENNVLYVSAYCTNEYGESPSYATLVLTTELLERVRTLRALISLHKLNSVASPTEVRWHESDGVRLDGDDMMVGTYGLWFEVRIKHQEGHVETRMIGYDQLAKFASGDQKVIFFDGGDTPDEEFVAMVEEEEALSASKEPG